MAGDAYCVHVKPVTRILLFTLMLGCVLAPVAWAAGSGGSTAKDRSPAAPLAGAVSTVTGIAISPLLGTSAYGLYRWVEASDAERPNLPWYAQPKFWLPALLLVGVVAVKDSLGATVPAPLKKPLDVLEVVENKFSGLVAAGAVVPFAVDSFTKVLLESAKSAEAMHGSGLAMIPGLGMSWAPVLDVLTIPFGIAIFVVVWMASHAINVLILLSPWGAIDAGLKAARTGLLGLLTLTSMINPVVGAVLSVVVIVFAYFIAGWAFRLTIFGAVFSWDFFTRRRNRFTPAADANRVFSGAAFNGVPVRTYGRLVRRDGGGLEFVYRPWLVAKPRTAVVLAPQSELAVGSGLFFSVVMPTVAGGTVFLLPPRYRGHEEAIAQAYSLGGGVRPAGLRKAWSSLKELIGGQRGVGQPAVAAG